MTVHRRLAETVFHKSGALALLRAAKRDRARILMYHGFDGPPETVRDHLSRQCEHLRRYYTPVSLSRIAESIRTRAPLPPNSLAVTVDDGYRNLQIAFPIFRAFGFSVTVYVVSEFTDGRIWLWPDQVKYASRAGQRLPVPSADAYEQLLMELPNAERLQRLESLAVPTTPPPGCEPLSWDELRAMAAQGLEVGAHTRTHPILSRLETPGQTADEIAGSKRRIEQAVGLKVRHFCYPNGRLQDYDAATLAAVRDAGYETAVTTVPGVVGPTSDPFQLPRLGVEPDDPQLPFERWVSGLHQRR